ncbi:MAG TPA: alpha-glucan family phosphorylase [Longimicrobiales bacterium]
MAEKTLPAPIRDLRFLAHNLRWSWHAETRALFERLDPGLWNAAHHNPVLLLERLDPIYSDIIVHDPRFCADIAAAADELRTYLAGADTWYKRAQGSANMRVAYFSAEFAITEALPIYSGGLGVLAGDHLKSASDLGIPLVAVTLLYREGYFRQRIDEDGKQHERYDPADPRILPVTLERDELGEPIVVDFPILDHQGYAQIWRADVGRVPLYLLDTDIPQNRPENRRITDRLYGGDNEHRLRQEIVLGIGGVRALRALQQEPSVIHLNEGHAAFAAVEYMRTQLPPEHGAFYAAGRKLSQRVAFTTHTPVPAGHDMFPTHLMERYLGGYVWEMREPWRRFLATGRHDPTDDDEPFNMTLLALRLSGRRNGVSKLHGDVSRRMWSGVWPGIAEDEVPIRSITNGVHLSTWVSPIMADLYKRYVGSDWAEVKNEEEFSGAAQIPVEKIWAARTRQRLHLVHHARRVLGAQRARRGEAAHADHALNPEALTIVFARRFATYKRATLLLSDPPRLAKLLNDNAVQFIFAGKAHPKDDPGKELLRQIYAFGQEHNLSDKFLFLEDYEVGLARFLVSGADVWLNVPRKPYEASGTSGMKAAANGALNLSIPDGWWAEAWQEHNNLEHPIGWSIDVGHLGEGQDRADADELYRLLESDVVPLYFKRDEHGVPRDWCERVKASILQNVPYFNTHRMVADYTRDAYLPAHRANGKSSERIA